MAKQIAVDREVLKWARRTAGLDESSAATKLNISVEELKSLEAGNGHPTVTLFHKMVSVYHRAPTIMLIPSPPPDDPLPKDYRTKGGYAPSFSPETYFAIREARSVQQEISDLQKESTNLSFINTAKRISIKESAEKIAIYIREALSVAVDEQLSWTRNDSFKYWRSRVQDLGILILAKSMPIEDCWGFSIIDDQLMPVIVVNKNVGPEANSFTLFHEVGHLLLRTGGICVGINRNEVTERWCNDFAGAVLVPEEALVVVAEEFEPGVIIDWTVSRVQQIARKLKISKDVVALRLQYLRSANPTLYDEVKQSPRVIPKPIAGGFAKPYQSAIVEVGSKTASIVLEALEQQVIDYGRATQILDLNAKWFADLQNEIHRYQKYNIRKNEGD